MFFRRKSAHFGNSRQINRWSSSTTKPTAMFTVSKDPCPTPDSCSLTSKVCGPDPWSNSQSYLARLPCAPCLCISRPSISVCETQLEANRGVELQWVTASSNFRRKPAGFVTESVRAESIRRVAQEEVTSLHLDSLQSLSASPSKDRAALRYPPR
jgi:hypothetical protein